MVKKIKLKVWKKTVFFYFLYLLIANICMQKWCQKKVLVLQKTKSLTSTSIENEKSYDCRNAERQKQKQLMPKTAGSLRG